MTSYSLVEFLLFMGLVALVFGLIEIGIRRDIREIERIINNKE